MMGHATAAKRTVLFRILVQFGFGGNQAKVVAQQIFFHW
jgi:hypothetical protein